MRKFIGSVVSGVVLSSVFLFAGPTTISDNGLLFVQNKYVCYKPLKKIINTDQVVYLKRDESYERLFNLEELKDIELFDEFKVARGIPQKLYEIDKKTENIINSEYLKIRDIVIKIGCVSVEKVELNGKRRSRDIEAFGLYVDDIKSATFPHSLKEVYETISKELDK